VTLEVSRTAQEREMIERERRKLGSTKSDSHSFQELILPDKVAQHLLMATQSQMLCPSRNERR
jgi:hypothetical protein